MREKTKHDEKVLASQEHNREMGVVKGENVTLIFICDVKETYIHLCTPGPFYGVIVIFEEN